MIEDYSKKIDDLKNLMFSGGGTPQALDMINVLMSPFDGVPTLEPEDILINIGNQLKSLRRIMYSGGVMNAQSFLKMMKDYIPKGKQYACLDKNLKFCVKEVGKDSFEDILYLFPYMNILTAYDICNKEEYPKMLD